MISYESLCHRLHLAALLMGLAAALPAAAQAQVEAQRRRPADLEWRLRTLAGEPLRLGDVSGRPIVLNVWATWCKPCVAELRSLQALHDSLAAEGIAFALVSPEPPSVVRRFVQRRKIALPVYVEDGPLPAVFGMRAVPTTWLIDRDGRIAATRRGAADWDTAGVRALLRALRSERLPARIER